MKISNGVMNEIHEARILLKNFNSKAENQNKSGNFLIFSERLSKMSHISLYETYERQNQVLQTPCPKDKGRRVSDFTPAAFATPAPKAFLNRPTPSVRKVNAGTDLVAEIEEEENKEAIKSLQNRNWKIYSFSPFFNFDSKESPKALQTFLTTKLQNSEGKSIGNVQL